MKPLGSIRVATVLLALSFASPREALPQAAAAPRDKHPGNIYPSEAPATFQPSSESWDYARRIAEIPMRDGVRLHTVILVPKGAKGAGILLISSDLEELLHLAPRVGVMARGRLTGTLAADEATPERVMSLATA